MLIAICPNPATWDEVHRALITFYKSSGRLIEKPPTPLILAGWVYSNDDEKKLRWEKTVAWAIRNGCPHLVEIDEEDFYSVVTPSNYQIGPMGGPMYLRWCFNTKVRPQGLELTGYLIKLKISWRQIVGSELGNATSPINFSGHKARALIVKVKVFSTPPWGGWDWRSVDSQSRSTFRKFRASVNHAIHPHMVDHIYFKY
jgi:hypothetical protein